MSAVWLCYDPLRGRSFAVTALRVLLVAGSAAAVGVAFESPVVGALALAALAAAVGDAFLPTRVRLVPGPGAFVERRGPLFSTRLRLDRVRRVRFDADGVWLETGSGPRPLTTLFLPLPPGDGPAFAAAVEAARAPTAEREP